MSKVSYWKNFLISGVLLYSLLLGCNSSSSSSPQNECFRTGEFGYTHYKSLADDPAIFDDSSELQQFWGRTLLFETENGFFFQGGEDASWRIDAMCEGPNKAGVLITLSNKCPGEPYRTFSSSTLDIRPDGSLVIHPYHITWTCGGELSYFVKEWWEMEQY